MSAHRHLAHHLGGELDITWELLVHALRPFRGPNPSANPIDEEDLLARVDGDVTLLAEIVDLFLEDADALLDDVRQAVEAGDPERVVRAAHRLKGSVLTLSAAHAARAALGVETLGRDRAVGRLEDALGALEVEIERLVPALDALRARLRRPAA